MADCWRSGPRDARAATTYLRLKHLGFGAFRIDVDVQYTRWECRTCSFHHLKLSLLTVSPNRA